jgi:hypothetical protein
MGYWMQRAKHLRDEGPNVDPRRSGDRNGQAQGPPILQPGTVITWLSGDGKPRGPAPIDFINADHDGTIWAFVTVPDGWAAINIKYVTVVRTA